MSLEGVWSIFEKVVLVIGNFGTSTYIRCQIIASISSNLKKGFHMLVSHIAENSWNQYSHRKTKKPSRYTYGSPTSSEWMTVILL